MGNIDAGQMAQWEQDMVRAWDWGLIDLGVQGMGVEEWTNGQYFNRQRRKRISLQKKHRKAKKKGKFRNGGENHMAEDCSIATGK